MIESKLCSGEYRYRSGLSDVAKNLRQITEQVYCWDLVNFGCLALEEISRFRQGRHTGSFAEAES